MKKTLDTIIGILYILFFIFTTALGLWFMQGGDLRDLKDGCYQSSGCE
ncbi:hypothetical protein [Alkalihalobacterium alkalinitrilicum]|nr:hypothetical protein [Alkalihalobacterium alkalinitrilicum]